MDIIRTLAFGAPVLILSVSLLTVFRNIRALQKIKLFVWIYIISIISGILSDILLGLSQFSTAFIAGVISPIIYSFLVLKFAKDWVIKSELSIVGELKREIFNYYYRIKTLISILLLPLILSSLAVAVFIIGYTKCSWGGCSNSDRTFVFGLLFLSVALLILSFGILIRNIIRKFKCVKTT
ncbi:MAG: hypothetical protein JKX78_05065 [Alteromonadaceae bacterium]|nr:hypothetical protein [Alteromonadaceae bacterium]